MVFDDLFGPEGSEVFFRPAAEYGLVGREVDFAQIHQAVAHDPEFLPAREMLVKALFEAGKAAACSSRPSKLRNDT